MTLNEISKVRKDLLLNTESPFGERSKVRNNIGSKRTWVEMTYCEMSEDQNNIGSKSTKCQNGRIDFW